MRLKGRRDVRKQHELRLAIGSWQIRAEVLENIQCDRARLARVHVPRVFARPAKRFARDPLDSGGIDLARLPEIEFRLRKIVADDADKFHRRKEARAQGSVGGRTA